MLHSFTTSFVEPLATHDSIPFTTSFVEPLATHDSIPFTTSFVEPLATLSLHHCLFVVLCPKSSWRRRVLVLISTLISAPYIQCRITLVSGYCSMKLQFTVASASHFCNFKCLLSLSHLLSITTCLVPCLVLA